MLSMDDYSPPHKCQNVVREARVPGLRCRPQALRTNKRITAKITAATAAEAGIVRTQAQTIRRATPQRTALVRWIDHTLTIAPVMVCVVLTGMPAKAVPNSVMAPAVSAQKPPTGFSLVIFEPMV